eukprot:970580-Amorphochlora_amoeboformis.AAC.1
MSDFEGDLDERPEDEVQSHGEEGEREDDGYDEKDDREEVEGEEREGEEDEDEEREGEGGEDDDDGKGRKRRKLDRARFFEDEAEESGEDVDDRDDDEEWVGEGGSRRVYSWAVFGRLFTDFDILTLLYVNSSHWYHCAQDGGEDEYDVNDGFVEYASSISPTAF